MESQSMQSLPREADAGYSAAYRYLESLLSDAGIQLDGTRPWDMRLRRAGVALYHLRARWFNLQAEYGVWPRSLRPGQRLLCQPCWMWCADSCAWLWRGIGSVG